MDKFEYTIKATKITTVEQMNNICAANIGKEAIAVVKTIEKDTFMPCIIVAIRPKNNDLWETRWEYYHVPVSLAAGTEDYTHFKIVNNIITPKD